MSKHYVYMISNLEEASNSACHFLIWPYLLPVFLLTGQKIDMKNTNLALCLAYGSVAGNALAQVHTQTAKLLGRVCQGFTHRQMTLLSSADLYNAGVTLI